MNTWIKVIDDILQYRAVDRSANKYGYSFLKKKKTKKPHVFGPLGLD